MASVDMAVFALPYGEATADVSVQRFRDVLKLCVPKKSGAVLYLLLDFVR